MPFSLFIFLLYLVLCSAGQPVIHLPIERRGGSLGNRSVINLDRFSQLADDAESRYGHATRILEDNGVRRRWKSTFEIVVDGSDLQAEMGRNGSWYTWLKIGEPVQYIQLDVDMLTPDFYFLSTTSQQGSIFKSFFSSTHVEYGRTYVHPVCRMMMDVVVWSLDSDVISSPLDIPTCSPPRFSRQTHRPHGSILGLGPPSTMARLARPSLINRLQDRKLIGDTIWSLTLLNREKGILSLGGTSAEIFEEAKIRTQVELKYADDPSLDAATADSKVRRLMSSFPGRLESAVSAASWENAFRWSPVQGAEGWWTALMSGVWVNGAKVLKTQPVLFDVQVPFILAPPLAVRTFYEGISGAKRLSEPHERFYVFPCLNAPNIAAEFDSWMFPLMSGPVTSEEILAGHHGGRFSLGKVRGGSGFCVGAVVESRLGRPIDEEGYTFKKGKQEAVGVRDSGLQNTWIMGEPFFQGIGVVFDAGQERVGFRSY